MRWLAFGSGLLLSLLLGFAAGRTTAPAPVPSSPDCERQLELAVGIIEAQERGRVGSPLPFPEDLPPQYGPARFEAEVRAALEACPDAGLTLAHVDCDEFPCMAFFSQPEGTLHHGADRLRECASWKERFAQQGQANSHFMTEQGVREYSVLSPSPERIFDANASKRWKTRLALGTEELMAAWGRQDRAP